MIVAFRVDASFQIGTGHVMRCLTLADDLRSKGVKIVFVCRKHPGHLDYTIKAQGYEVIGVKSGLGGECYQDYTSLSSDASWFGLDQSNDAEQTIEALQGNGLWDWIIVDHYALDYSWESAVREVANKIMVIDDLADRKHDCDLLLDQNYFHNPEKRYKGLLPEHCESLLGPKYALLRPEFREARKFCRMRGGGVGRVLVYFGGNDPDNITGMALEALSDPDLSHLVVDAVVGPDNPNIKQLEKQAHNRPGTRLHIQPEGFTELMLRADLCIGAGGTTTWERLCLGLPSLVITVAENQEPFTAELHNDGLITWIGRKENVSVSDIKNSLESEIKKLQNQDFFSNSPNPVDGLGTLRVAEKIVPTNGNELTLRGACQEDMELFYYWANDPVVRENSFQQEPISWEKHVSWFQNKLASQNTYIWVLQTPSVLPVGMVRLDVDQEAVNISYSLDSIARGRGWGLKLVQLGIDKIYELDRGKIIQAKVKQGNIASIKIFHKLGFKETGEDDVITFRKIIP